MAAGRGICGFEEENEFFDSREEFSSTSGSCPGSPGVGGAEDLGFGVWSMDPSSVQERRDRFMRWMGLNPAESSGVRKFVPDVDRICEDSGAVSGSSDCGLNSGECSLDNDRDVSSDELMMSLAFEGNSSPSVFVQQLMRREDSNNSSTSSERSVRRRKMGWLKRLGSVACIADREVEEDISLNSSDLDKSLKDMIQRIKVRPYRKRVKEFSAVYMGQDIQAHEGAILTMKFSPDGQFLASGGEDGVVRVWRVMECERSDDDDLLEGDPSCVYFRVNQNSELVPLYADKEKKSKFKGVRRSSDSACVVVPPNVFRISEEPIHEFRGHDGDVLDLSWSKNQYLLSSSDDKTVRLWRVGFNGCVKVFSHSNYVTCIQFNPMDENYFISGSIDGKIRIWDISRCRVVDWTDVKEIVTAVCYRPDGKGGVVGTMTGDCRFYDTSDNQLQLDAKVSFQGKKKSVDKRITGFQFCPSDHQKLMVTSADSQVRILDGVDVISKYKGLRNAGSRISASFTSDGRHIISASEDSNVYVWAHTNQGAPTSHQAKSTWSCERLISGNASVAIPWNGLESRNRVSFTSEAISEASSVQNGMQEPDSSGSSNTVYLSPSGSFTLSNEFFSDFLPKGSATWPEEKLPPSTITATSLCKSQYKFLKSSCQYTSHAWGQVIVAADWDGRIRSFQNYGLPVHT
ncbi:LOW QUALITY PROTEIN: 2-deoxy-glucose resistant protein 2-like [Dioscorea cayenensis subsp. rotundata]|uniref:LOW QUALITY PROTEIN: 2-deoxy-glucose resistant protein 2-like n=1 Tax=Dioscorea cayennensis subsp. rotundata TaxID=55577 RepID=A0AB40CSR3_DIOCR|nr:LOW QUALITY PROTEIN: 2-deoxy-glucose resistant protein 2-like [Dioscorea cayenensis subsp. rotundata]